MEYRTSARSMWATYLALPFTLLFTLAGIVIFDATGINVFSIVFTLLGLAATVAVLNSSWCRVAVKTNGIQKRNLLSRTRLLAWNDIKSWEHVAPLGDEFEVIILLSNKKSKWRIYAFEVESPGIGCFLLDLRNRIGELELHRKATDAE